MQLSASLPLAGLLLGGSVLAQGSFTNLGAGLTPSAVSADGSVVAGTDFVQYFRWTAGTGVVPVGGVSASQGGVGGSATLSYDGRYFSGTTLNPITNKFEMSRYDGQSAAWQVLGSLGASSGQDASSGWGISGDGQQEVGLGWINAGSANGIYWTSQTGVVSLGTTVPNRSTRANATDYDGDVIVGWQDNTTGFRQGAVWTNGAQTLISGAGGSPLGEAGAVSADGKVVGGIGVSSNSFQAYLWSASGGATNLGHLNPTYRGSVTGVSGDGKVAVGFDRPFGPALFGRGFLWTAATGMVDMNTVAANAGINVGNAVLSLPLAISADGLTVVGAGLLNNQQIGWRLVLPPAACGYQGYGYGAAAANELVLTGSSTPNVGGQARFLLTNAFGNTGTIGLSTASGSLPFGDVVLLLDLVGLFGTFATTPVAQGALFTAQIPNNPNWAGVTLYAQGIAFEPTQPGLIAASNGLRLTVCP
jgi:hypothetical protein